MFLSPQSETPLPIFSSFQLPHSLSAISLLSVSVPGISYKWNPTLCGPLCLASFTRHHVFKGFQIVACAGALLLFMAESYFTVRMDHILFTYPPVEGHLGYLQPLATVKSAYMCLFIYFPSSPSISSSSPYPPHVSPLLALAPIPWVVCL